MSGLVFSREGAARLLSYWADEGFGWAVSPTASFFADKIEKGEMEFWTAQEEGRIVSELSLFLTLEDPDFADGLRRCYLCAFRTTPARRGQGIGTQLMRHVLARAMQLGFSEASIGVDERETQNVRLYRRMGFAQTVKTALVDPCSRMPDGRPCPDRFLLLLKTL